MNDDLKSKNNISNSEMAIDTNKSKICNKKLCRITRKTDMKKLHLVLNYWSYRNIFNYKSIDNSIL